MDEQPVIRIKCPNLSCQRILAVPGHARGKLVRCRGCSTTIRVPAEKLKPIESTSSDSSAAPVEDGEAA